MENLSIFEAEDKPTEGCTTYVEDAMPPFFDRVQLDRAQQDQAVPRLQAFAANDDLLNRPLMRFERDEPSPTPKSTELEDLNYVPPLP
ncbi:hypothetical protein DM02DRAFT_657862 [Periconia macrospinosa]|uniref:Uncharacterized protein n=1 Tax=Periconia macrospinosa TaxID=97972 RepID=A0A2V1DI58_9PLEO|nr:hypothetical protein DM02DRAFT_657862 [Periconia macrospinosa]